MKTIQLILLLGIGSVLQAQTSYIGTVAGEEIRFSTDAHEFSTEVTAVYSMGPEIVPFWMTGSLEEKSLNLAEYMDGELISSIVIEDFDNQESQLQGKMTFMGSGESFDLVLNRDFSLEGDGSWEDKRLEQMERTEYFYFAVILSKPADSYYARIKSVQIFDYQDALIQEFVGLDASGIRGFHSVEIADYNFDGVSDFSVFGEQYAGANTSSYYFLRNDSGEFIYNDELSQLTSADFDVERSTVIERNVSGPEEIIRFYSFDTNGKLEQLNMLPEEYFADDTSWELTKTQEGDFDPLVEKGSVVFLEDQSIYVQIGELHFNYWIRFSENRVILTNMDQEDDVLSYEIQEKSASKQIWTRLENDVFETWELTK